mmetsp:Transcript_39620/g.74397  ORF Transcript_39620/g.74397 Transcript_39620/m.74397 type:complete len:104 (-) Transcript_39620:807-1118(-)
MRCANRVVKGDAPCAAGELGVFADSRLACEFVRSRNIWLMAGPALRILSSKTCLLGTELRISAAQPLDESCFAAFGGGKDLAFAVGMKVFGVDVALEPKLKKS